METVFCVMFGKELFAIYDSPDKAEIIANELTEKYGVEHTVETRVVL